MLQQEPLYSYESSVRKRTSHGGEGEEKTDSQVTRTSIQETLKLSHINSNHLYDTKNPEDIQSIKIRHNEWLTVQRLLQPKTIGELHNIYTAWYKINPVDIELIDITLALATDRRIPGDPVWGNIVGPAGFWKTGLCRSISGLPEVYPLDVLTDKSLISGLVEKNKETGEREPVAGILKELNGKVLVIKDFTAVLSLRDYKRQAVLSQLRNAYDGYYDSAFGTLKEPIRVEVEFGFIAAVTPIINNYIKTLVTMGPRCLMVRIHDPPRRESARAARENLGKEETMRYQVKEAVSNYVKSLDFSKKIEVSSRIGDSIDALADYTALMRTHVMAKYYGGKMIDHNIPSPEAPTRLSKQLGKLGIGLALIRGHDKITSEDFKTLQRVGMDSAIPEFQLIIDYWIEHFPKNGLDALYTPYEISTNKKMNQNTTTNKLELMRIIGITEKDNVGA